MIIIKVSLNVYANTFVGDRANSFEIITNMREQGEGWLITT